MGSLTRRGFGLAAAAAIAGQSAACGTILYPERRGQKGGRIDPAVAIMDGLGLLLFILPGVVAFAVDFVTGAIYLPGGRRAELEDKDRVRVVPIPRQISPERLSEIVAQETGARVDLAKAEVREVTGVAPDTLVRLLNRNPEKRQDLS